LADLVIHNLGKRFGTTVALRDVDLELPHGKLVCFLGPSGCGKTTLLRLIAGLETPTTGQIRLGDTDLTRVPAHRRNIGMVFQSLALFPHLSVAENITYGMRIRGVPKSARRKRAEELLSLVQLEAYGERHVRQLSGGQRQRVAIARALALEPQLFLLDEPLSALDAKLRETMQVELRLLQERLGITTILVTHDQQEAMTLADVIVVMSDQRVQQVGTPLEVYHQPKTAFVADFLGTNNLVPARVESRASVHALGRTLTTTPTRHAVGEHVTLAIRPERVVLHTHEPSTGESGTGDPGTGEPGTAGNTMPGKVSFVRDLGAYTETHVQLPGQTLIVSGAPHLEVGTPVWLTLPPEHCLVVT
jgi:putative spermidine/putrescine transport system ATP-binding protein